MSSFSYKYLDVLPASEKPTEISSQKSLWQSPIWAEILIKTKQARDIILATAGDDEILIERRSIFRDYCGLYILGVHPELITEAFLDSCKKEVVTSNDMFLQIEPIGIVNGELGTVNSKKNPPFCFFNFAFLIGKKAPFRRFIEPVTAILNLENKTEEELQASFAEKGRYNIRLATKRGVITRWVTGSTKYQIPNTKYEKSYIQAFYDLLEETTERDGFSHNSLEYYQHFVEALERNNAGGLLVAEKDGILHAAGIFVYPSPLWKEGVERSETGDFQSPEPNSDFTGTQDSSGKSSIFASSATRDEVSSPLPFQKEPMGSAIYYYGASSSDRDIRRDMATYLLQWDAIREAMKRGCSEYDFLGISEDGTGKLAGVTEFKLRFNPEKRYLPAEQVIIYRPVILKLLQMISKIRKLFK